MCNMCTYRLFEINYRIFIADLVPNNCSADRAIKNEH